jgi:hypothetical protein
VYYAISNLSSNPCSLVRGDTWILELDLAECNQLNRLVAATSFFRSWVRGVIVGSRDRTGTPETYFLS